MTVARQRGISEPDLDQYRLKNPKNALSRHLDNPLASIDCSGSAMEETFVFYCDDSGKRDVNEYVHAAAYLGLATKWNQFSIDWRLRLASAGLSWFHASEFFPGAGKEFE